VLKEVTKIFMLDDRFVPKTGRLTWKGSLTVKTDGTPAAIPMR